LISAKLYLRSGVIGHAIKPLRRAGEKEKAKTVEEILSRIEF
jgi:hypothetical protein